MIYNHRDNSNLLSNQLIKAAKAHYMSNKFGVANNYMSEKHLHELDEAASELNLSKTDRTETESVENT